MRRRVSDLKLKAVSVEGAILSPDIVGKIARQQADRQAAEDYGIEKGLVLREEIGRAFNMLKARQADFEKKAKTAGEIRKHGEWLLRTVLGFELVRLEDPVVADGRQFQVSFSCGSTPVCIASVVRSEDGRKAGLDVPDGRFVDGKRRRSASATLQELLNADPARRWGLAFDGRVLRLMRDNSSLTRPAYVEFDVSEIAAEGLFGEFSLLWLMCHATRFAGHADETALEAWRERGREEGVVARERLRDAFKEALLELGNGFLEHPNNDGLRAALGKTVDLVGFQSDLLRLAYRLIFLITVEDRRLLHGPDSDAAAIEAYEKGYALTRLRDRTAKRVAVDRHHDLWTGISTVLSKLAVGEPRLGLPALGGLFSGGLCFDGCVISNTRVMKALRSLFWIRHEGALIRINWRDLETEEFGSVYEGLLELVPIPTLDKRAITYPGSGEQEDGLKRGRKRAKGKAAKGNQRKTTGSYYTPDSLVQLLLDSTLEPVIDNALRGAEDPEKAILGLRVIDPAVGSGHFVLGSARRLAKRLVEIRHPGGATRTEWQKAMRDVVRSCVYGVDLNPLAVDLCKAVLWLESIEPGRPLTFLDSHVRNGNSLFGVHDLSILEGGVPQDAYKPLTGDDRAWCNELKKADRETHKLRARTPGQFEFNFSEGFRAVVALNRAVEEQDDASLADVEAKRTAYEEFLGTENLMALQAACDLWCGAFFVGKEKVGDTETDAWNARRVPTSADVFDALNGSSGSVPYAVKAAAEEAARQAKLFHWPLEFPAVMADGGFHVVIGNPPWEKVKLVEKEYFATRAPEIAKAANKAARERLIASYGAEDPNTAKRLVFERYQIDKRVAEAGSLFALKSGRFPLTGQGDVNLYALFAEHFRHLVKRERRAGLICPTGIATDKFTSDFFGDLVSSNQVVSLFDFENGRPLFKGVHRSFKFCLLTMGLNRGPGRYACYLSSPVDLANEERVYELTAEQIALVNPNTRTIPLFRSRKDAEITAGIYARVPVLIRQSQEDVYNPWSIRFLRMFDMANDSGFFRTKEQLSKHGFTRAGIDWICEDENVQIRYVPLYEAKMVHHYDHRWATYEGAVESDDIDAELDVEDGDDDGPKARDVTPEEKADPAYEPEPRYWVPKEEVDRRLREIGWDRTWLMGWRDIARATDERTLIGAPIPAVGVGHKFLLFFTGESPALASALMACMSSLPVDYVVRQKVGGTSVTYFTLQQFPLLPPSAFDESEVRWIASRVVSLSCTSHALAGLDQDLNEQKSLKLANREQLRAELDAFFARKYGLTKMELAFILDPTDVMGEDYPSETFRALREKELAKHGSFRTRDLVLAAYDALASGIGALPEAAE